MSFFEITWCECVAVKAIFSFLYTPSEKGESNNPTKSAKYSMCKQWTSPSITNSAFEPALF